MLKKKTVLALAIAVIGTAVFCEKKPSPSPQEPREKKWMAVYHENELKDTVDITDWEPGTDHFWIECVDGYMDSMRRNKGGTDISYIYLWQGEDSIDYCLDEHHLLCVNGVPCGIDLRYVSADSVPDPLLITTAIVGPEQVSQLEKFPNLAVLNTHSFNDDYLPALSGLKGLQLLSLRRSNKKSQSSPGITDEGIKNLAGLTNLRVLDLSFTEVGGEGLAHLKNLSELRELNIYHTFMALEDSDFKHLKAFPELRKLRCNVYSHPDLALRHIGELTGLEELYLEGLDITDLNLRHLAGLTNLRVLKLSFTDVMGYGLRYLRGMVHLRYLSLVFSEVGSSGLRHLSGLVNLEVLDLFKTRVSSTGLRHLSGLTELRELDLGKTRVGNRGLEKISHFTNLRSLSLFDTTVSDKGLKYLEELPNLKELNLAKTKVTRQRIAGLQEVLPDCKISYWVE
jgi:hypothetical protein